jgi:hypothetical protein
MRGELEATLQRQAASIAEKAAAEREAAVRQAAEAARKEAQEQLFQVRRAADTQVATLQRELEQARRVAQEQVDSAKRTLQAEAAARQRAEAQVEDVRRIGRTQVEEAQRLMNDRVAALARELDDSRRETAVRRQELDSARGASADSLADLVRGLHTVDEAESLTAVFERLIDAAQPHSNGAVIMLVKQDGLRKWESGAFGGVNVTEKGMTVASNAATERRRVEAESAIAFPVNVGGEVVAVLYAEVGDALSPQRRMSKDALDALTRHAGRVLETITVEQAAGFRPIHRQLQGHGARPMGERPS